MLFFTPSFPHTFTDVWHLRGNSWLQSPDGEQRVHLFEGGTVCWGLGLCSPTEMVSPHQTHQNHAVPPRLGVACLPGQEAAGTTPTWSFTSLTYRFWAQLTQVHLQAINDMCSCSSPQTRLTFPRLMWRRCLRENTRRSYCEWIWPHRMLAQKIRW